MIPPGTGRGAWVPEGMRESSVHREGAVDPQLRLADMDIEGIDIAVLYGVVSLGFYAMRTASSPSRCCRAYNDWLADYCAADPSRLKGTPALPLEWIDDACAEAERSVRDLGFVSITAPCAVGDRNADDAENFPLYELAEELDVPIGFHAGGGRFAYSQFVDSYAQLHALEFPFNIMFAMTTIVCGGVLERFPRLRGRAARSRRRLGAVLRRAARRTLGAPPDEMPNITKAPSEYFAEGRLFVSTEGERSLDHVCAHARAGLRRVGIGLSPLGQRVPQRGQARARASRCIRRAQAGDPAHQRAAPLRLDRWRRADRSTVMVTRPASEASTTMLELRDITEWPELSYALGVDRRPAGAPTVARRGRRARGGDRPACGRHRGG